MESKGLTLLLPKLANILFLEIIETSDNNYLILENKPLSAYTELQLLACINWAGNIKSNWILELSYKPSILFLLAWHITKIKEVFMNQAASLICTKGPGLGHGRRYSAGFML